MSHERGGIAGRQRGMPRSHAGGNHEGTGHGVGRATRWTSVMQASGSSSPRPASISSSPRGRGYDQFPKCPHTTSHTIYSLGLKGRDGCRFSPSSCCGRQGGSNTPHTDTVAHRDADTHGHTQTDTHRHAQTQTDAHRRTQTHTDANRHTHIIIGRARGPQRKRR